MCRSLVVLVFLTAIPPLPAVFAQAYPSHQEGVGYYPHPPGQGIIIMGGVLECETTPIPWENAIPLDAIFKGEETDPVCHAPSDWAKPLPNGSSAAQRLQDQTRLIDCEGCDAEAYNRRAVAWAQQGLNQGLHSELDVRAALDDLAEALRLDPNFALAYFNRGMLLYSMMEYGQAVRDFSEVIRLNKCFTAAYLARGKAFAEMDGRKPQAARDFTTALRLDPNFGCARDAFDALHPAPVPAPPPVLAPPLAPAATSEELQALQEIGNRIRNLGIQNDKLVTEFVNLKTSLDVQLNKIVAAINNLSNKLSPPPPPPPPNNPVQPGEPVKDARQGAEVAELNARKDEANLRSAQSQYQEKLLELQLEKAQRDAAQEKEKEKAEAEKLKDIEARLKALEQKANGNSGG